MKKLVLIISLMHMGMHNAWSVKPNVWKDIDATKIKTSFHEMLYTNLSISETRKKINILKGQE